MFNQRDAMASFAQDVDRALKECAKWESERRRGELLDGVAELASSQFDRAATYATVVVGAGYAGFFAAWATLGAGAHPLVHVIAGLCAVLSLLIFVIWEVYKMGSAGLVIGRVVPLLNADPHNEHENLNRIRSCLRNHNLWMARFWPWALAATLLPACGAAVLLIALFVYRVVETL